MDAGEIRHATAEDVPAGRRLAAVAWHATYDDIPGQGTVDEILAEWYDPDRVSETLTDPDGLFRL